MFGGDLGGLARVGQHARHVHAALELDDAARLRELAAVGAGVPLVPGAVAEPEAHLVEAHLAPVRLLLDLRGVERVERLAVRAGLGEARIAGGVAGVVGHTWSGRVPAAFAARSGYHQDA